jgi:hypothetical protein
VRACMQCVRAVCVGIGGGLNEQVKSGVAGQALHTCTHAGTIGRSEYVNTVSLTS